MLPSTTFADPSIYEVLASKDPSWMLTTLYSVAVQTTVPSVTVALSGHAG
jgi:hypothetical protein